MRTLTHRLHTISCIKGKGRTIMTENATPPATPSPSPASPQPESGKPKPWFKRLSLTTWIFIALILGVLAGLAL